MQSFIIGERHGRWKKMKTQKKDWLGDHQRIKQPLGQFGILIQSGNHHGANEWKKDMWLPNYGVALYEVLTKKASKNTLKCDTEAAGVFQGKQSNS
ncbi:hypothetical protein PV326_000720 [Microctonus aethiopoides]|nr:hypothetical protein PV326_000720 [Microctonus aethiopoides]